MITELIKNTYLIPPNKLVPICSHLCSGECNLIFPSIHGRAFIHRAWSDLFRLPGRQHGVYRPPQSIKTANSALARGRKWIQIFEGHRKHLRPFVRLRACVDLRTIGSNYPYSIITVRRFEHQPTVNELSWLAINLLKASAKCGGFVYNIENFISWKFITNNPLVSQVSLYFSSLPMTCIEV